MFSRVRDSVRWALALASLILVAGALSCAKKEETATTPPPAAETTPAALTDANIAAIVVAANTIDIKNAELAKSKSKNADAGSTNR